MSIVNRIRQRQIVREAEGYLDLALQEDYLAPLGPPQRRLVERTLESLDKLREPGPAGNFLRGLALRSLDRFDEAIGPLRLAADAEPGDIHTRLALGWCYKRVGRIDLAIGSLEEALAADASQAILHYNLACYWSLAQNSRRALTYLAQALELDKHYRLLMDGESDFDNIRSDPGFQSLTAVTV